jgi:NAD(P)-dependent dehydrogenase (short-subunit alcohol dehydrogenase family)
VITGGGAGIGLSISQSFAVAGASKIVIIGRRTSVLEKAAASIHNLVGNKTQVFTVSADVANKEQVDEAFSKISTAFGGKPLDILVNNAGYYSGVRPYGTETTEEWRTALDINVLGVYNITTAFIVNAKPDATLINISSGVAHIVPFHGFSAYATTKIAGARLFETIQHEKPALHVINLHPGQVVETEMANKLAADMPHVDDGTFSRSPKGI